MIKINLLPKELAVHRETNLWTVAAFVVPVITLGVVAAMHIMRTNEDAQLTEDLTVMRADLEARKEALNTVKQLERQKAELSVYSSVRSNLEALSSDWRGDLERFVSQIPTGSANPTISLSSLGVSTPTAATGVAFDGRPSSKVMTIQGIAKSNQALIDFVKAFEDSQDFAIQFQNAQKQAENNQYDFTVNVNLIKASATETTPGTTPATTPAPSGTTTPTTTSGGSTQ
ncbi:PilN domain-containing protein [Deinococcus roseus]|uniref:PilN biogenesis protein dimerization domain-containing protein n=1 Tax=Deinococcus roseus TaxID=392414 RepID=A0ABQ2CXP2_9DEIO|nr:hypothetical protein [Deinococcus roseus]GGJ30790.1 hypothetical protein GCM10008938_16050 [Deinococcus roseus]